MISVIIPTYNEEKNIKKISNELIRSKIVSEVIFVDDRSIDKTCEEIRKIKNKKIVLYERKKAKRDLSKSVVMGASKAINKTILVMDCDLQHDTKYISLMFKKFQSNNFQIIVGSRFLKENFSGNLGFLRSLISRLAIYIINFIFGKKTSDPLSGFFLCKKAMILDYKKNFFNKGYKILFDIIYNGSKVIKVYDQPILFKKRYSEKSKFNIKIICLFIRQMLFTKMVAKK